MVLIQYWIDDSSSFRHSSINYSSWSPIFELSFHGIPDASCDMVLDTRKAQRRNTNLNAKVRLSIFTIFPAFILLALLIIPVFASDVPYNWMATCYGPPIAGQG